MLICVPDVLSSSEVAEVRRLTDAAQWEDGRMTAGTQSAMVKNNLQLPEEAPETVAAQTIVLRALARSPLFLSAALPKTIFPPLFNSYGVGQHFGVHVDNAIRVMPRTGERIRTDLSMTLFLTDPETYDGGELLIETQYGAQEVKLAAGHMVLYPSTSLHQVRAVSRGNRVSCFTWLQSIVRDETQRTTLFDLDQSIQALTAELGGDHDQTVRLTGIYHNLVRIWGDI